MVDASGLGYRYDIAGRRLELEFPNQLRPSTSQVQRYTYSRGASGTGELTAVEGLMGESVSFQHDLGWGPSCVPRPWRHPGPT